MKEVLSHIAAIQNLLAPMSTVPLEKPTAARFDNMKLLLKK
jgi:hypothetical protein